jgi:hypothetical protein
VDQTDHGDLPGGCQRCAQWQNLAVAGVDAQQQNVKAGLAGKLACTIVSFDWPSWAETFAYLPQLDVAKKTAIDLVNAGVRPMLAAQKKDCRVAIQSD